MTDVPPGGPKVPRRVQQAEDARLLPPGTQSTSMDPFPPIPDPLQDIRKRLAELEARLGQLQAPAEFDRRRAALRAARRYVNGPGMMTSARVHLELVVAMFLLGEHGPDSC